MEANPFDGLDGLKIALCQGFTECRGWGPNQSSVTRLAYFLGRHTGIDFDYWEISGDAYVDRFRNTAAKRLLDSDREWLFFIDTDERFGILDWLKVMLSPGDMVGAGYPCKNVWDFYGCILNCHDDGRPIVNEHGLLSAYIVPTGFMKIHRRVFETVLPTVDIQRLANPDGEPTELPDFFGRFSGLGEDGSFNIRCERAGVKRWVQPDVTIGHLGVKEWAGNYGEWLKALPGGVNGPEVQP